MKDRLTTSLNLRLDTRRKEKLDKLAEQYAVTPGQLVRGYIDAVLDMSPPDLQEILRHQNDYSALAKQIKSLGEKIEALERRQLEHSVSRKPVFGGRKKTFATEKENLGEK